MQQPWKSLRSARRLRRFHARCDRFGIPADVRERLLRGGVTNIGWYGGRLDMRFFRRLTECHPNNKEDE